ncbi:VCBS repeat-containing protein [Gibbsiella quercinecans]|nr:VCBS repeat-containing protein [Gibbsiella quercinecans]
MSVQLLIKDIKGNVVSQHSLNSNHPLSLRAPQQPVFFEIHSSDGHPPRGVKVEQSHGDLKLKIADKNANESYDIVIENFPATEQPVITAAGADGVTYPYSYDVETGLYLLPENFAEPQTSELSPETLLSAGSALLSAAALAVGISAYNKKTTVVRYDDETASDSSTANESTNTGESSGAVSTDTASDADTDESGSTGDDAAADSGTDESGSTGGDVATDSGTDENGSTGGDAATDSGTDEDGSTGDDTATNIGTDEDGSTGGDAATDSDTDEDGSTDDDASTDTDTDENGSTGDDTATDTGTGENGSTDDTATDSGTDEDGSTGDDAATDTGTGENGSTGDDTATDTDTGENGSTDDDTATDSGTDENGSTDDTATGTDENGSTDDTAADTGTDENGSTGDDAATETGTGEDGSTGDTATDTGTDEDGSTGDDAATETGTDEDGSIGDDATTDSGTDEDGSTDDDTATDTGTDESGSTDEDGSTSNNSGIIIVDDAGNAISDGGTLADNTPTLSGSDQTPGSTVVISDGETVLGETTVDEEGSWSFTPEAALVDGEHDLTVTVTDPAGNTSSDTLHVIVDTLAPAGVDPDAVTILDDAGTLITAGSLTANSTPAFVGEGLEAGTTVIIRDNGTVLAEITVDEDGNWSYTPDAALAEGEHSFTFEVVDNAGNSNGESAAIVLTVDSVAPEGVDISTVVITDEAGDNVSAANTLQDSKITLSGSDLEVGTTVTIYDKGNTIGETTVDQEGNWSFTVSDGLYDGSHEITFAVTDAAGNSSGQSETLNLAVSAVTLTATDNISSGAAIGFSYPTSVEEEGTVLSDGGLISFYNVIESDVIIVADGTVADLAISATSSALVDLLSSSSLALMKYESSTGQWVNVSVDSGSNLLGLFGLGATTSTIEINGLSAGSYKLVYTNSGLNIGVGFSVDVSKTVYTLADEATLTDYTTATGNVIGDADNVYGSDSIPHAAYTTVTAVSFTNAAGETTLIELGETGATLVGEYGSLTIKADGSYVYTPIVNMASIGKVDTFTYTLTDSATGETSSANLYIQIGSGNEALTLSWDPTDPSAIAVTDSVSNDVADASVLVTYHSSSVATSDLAVKSAATVYSDSFTLNAAADLVSGSLTLVTASGFLGLETFSQDMTITYSLQMLNSSGSWVTVSSQQITVASGLHSKETVLDLDLSSLNYTAGGDYRIAVTTSGANNELTLNMAAQVVSSTEYVISGSTRATGNVLTDEGTDGSVDVLSSIYTKMYAKAGDSAGDQTVDSSYTYVTESGVSLVGEYGTLVLYNNGAYTYTPNLTSLPGGTQDVFTYALKGANGEVVTATVTINLGVSVDGSSGGALVFSGTETDDVFAIYDTDFVSVDGGEGRDTLAWHGNGELVLNSIADKVSNIEVIDLLSGTQADNLVIAVQSVVGVTNGENTLYITGEAGNTVTLLDSWVGSGSVVVDSVTYTHYVATAEDGSAVHLYVQKDIALSSTVYQDSTNGAVYEVASGSSQAITGTVDDDTFNVNDTSFASIDGGAGKDTLVWNGSGTLLLSDIASKISNIEEIDLLNNGEADNLVITAQNVADITDEYNTLYVKGAAGDTMTLSGSWQLSGSVVVNNASYIHYTSTTASGETVHLYIDKNIQLSATESVSETNAADITGQVSLVSDHVANTATMQEASSSFTSDSFTVQDSSDLQTIGLSVSGSINGGNTVTVAWSLQVYNTQTYTWQTVENGSQAVTSASALNIELNGLGAGTYRIVVDSTQSGYSGLLWQTTYNTLNVAVNVSIVSTTDYVVTASSNVGGSVFANDATSDGSQLVVKSVAAGIVTAAANYSLVSVAGTSIAGTYGTLIIASDGSYTYTLNSGSVIQLAGSEDSFTYVLSDGSTKTLVMTLGVSVDGAEGGELIFAGSVGDDSFTIYDTNFTSLDGKSGIDTLVWNGSGDLQLGTIADKVNNIEIIDLQSNDSAAALILTADDIVSVTDDSNTLYVRGGSEDSLSLQGVWVVSGVETLNNLTYTLYTSTTLDGITVNLYVQEGLTFNELNQEIVANSLLPEDDAGNLSVVSISQNGEVVDVTEGVGSLKGAYGTLSIDSEGHYSYIVDDAYAHSGLVETFTYALSDGSSATLAFNLGVDVDGSEGGELTFTGTSGADIFDVYDTDFISINGGDGNDTLSWHGSGTLNLSIISLKVKNIEEIDLLNDGENDNLEISAESLLKVTDDNNTLYVRGADGDSITLNGTWEAAGSLLVNGVTYNHYTSSTTDGAVVQLYVEDDVTIG